MISHADSRNSRTVHGMRGLTGMGPVRGQESTAASCGERAYGTNRMRLTDDVEIACHVCGQSR